MRILGYELTNIFKALVMHGIAWNVAFSLFPCATFCHREGGILWPGFQRLQLEAVRSRGFDIMRSTSEHRVLLPVGERRVGDRYTWRLPLSDVAGSTNDRPFALWCNMFSFRVRTGFFYDVDCYGFGSQLLTHDYTVTGALLVLMQDVLELVQRVAGDFFPHVQPRHYLCFAK